MVMEPLAFGMSLFSLLCKLVFKLAEKLIA